MSVTTPTIYEQDEAQISNDLLPVKKRLPKWLAWMKTILQGIQWLRDLAFINYYGGSDALAWVSLTAYSYGDRIKYLDGCVYEVINTSGVTSSTPPPQDTDNWMKILDTWIGVAERVKYNGQKIMVEYILNKYFEVGSVALPWQGANHSNQIFITDIAGIVGEFWLTNSANQLTSYMSNGGNQQYYLGNSYGRVVFSMNVPSAVDVAITANQVNGVIAEDVIRSVADKYIQAGYLYSYGTY